MHIKASDEREAKASSCQLFVFIRFSSHLVTSIDNLLVFSLLRANGKRERERERERVSESRKGHVLDGFFDLVVDLLLPLLDLLLGGEAFLEHKGPKFRDGVPLGVKLLLLGLPQLIRVRQRVAPVPVGFALDEGGAVTSPCAGNGFLSNLKSNKRKKTKKR